MMAGMRRAAIAITALAALFAWSTATATADSAADQPRLDRRPREQELRHHVRRRLPGAVPGADTAGEGRAAHAVLRHRSLEPRQLHHDDQRPAAGHENAGRLRRPIRSSFRPGRWTPTVAHGDGCVYPSNVLTVADQLEAKGLTWKAVHAGPGELDARRARDLPPPDHRRPDDTEAARPTDQYATKHNPFVYFHSIIDRQAVCDANVVDLSALTGDLPRRRPRPLFVHHARPLQRRPRRLVRRRRPGRGSRPSTASSASGSRRSRTRPPTRTAAS